MQVNNKQHTAQNLRTTRRSDSGTLEGRARSQGDNKTSRLPVIPAPATYHCQLSLPPVPAACSQRPGLSSDGDAPRHNHSLEQPDTEW